MVYLCNPNNPTGHLVSREKVRRVASALPESVIVVDEAFMDFVDDDGEFSAVPDVCAHPTLVVLRSLTKLFAIPGLRLGFLVAHPRRVADLRLFQEPWTVNLLAQRVGEHFVELDEYLRVSREEILQERRFLMDELSRLHWLRPYRGAANFLLVCIEHPRLDARTLNDFLVPRGVVVREASNFVGLDGRYFRIAVRRREDNETLVRLLHEIGERNP